MPERLRLLVQTPREIVYDGLVSSVRVPTQSGQVGLRPRGEPGLSVVEPGLIVTRIGQEHGFVASAGGLLDINRERALLLTPFAAAGSRDSDVLSALADALATPDSEINARKRLGELEQRILHELREPSLGPGAQGTQAQRGEP